LLQATPLDVEEHKQEEDDEFRPRNFSNVKIGGVRVDGEHDQDESVKIVSAALVQEDISEDHEDGNSEAKPLKKKGTLGKIGNILKSSFHGGSNSKKRAGAVEDQTFGAIN